MASRPRDNQRAKVYRAERKALNFNVQYRTVAECQARVDQITGSRWWWGRYGHHPRAALSMVEVKPGKGHRNATADARPYGGVLQLPLWARSDVVICHELAHIVTKPHAAHGPEFAREFIALVDRWISKEAGRSLRQAFKAERVRYRVVKRV